MQTGLPAIGRKSLREHITEDATLPAPESGWPTEDFPPYMIQSHEKIDMIYQFHYHDIIR